MKRLMMAAAMCLAAAAACAAQCEGKTLQGESLPSVSSKPFLPTPQKLSSVQKPFSMDPIEGGHIPVAPHQ